MASSLNNLKTMFFPPKQSENVVQSTQPVKYQAPQITKPTEVLLEWEAPERMFEPKPREFYRKIAVIIMFFILLLMLIKEFLLIAVLGVVFFVVYVFTTVPPRKVTHQITNNGINFAGDKLFRWEELKSFFIDKKNNTEILCVDTVAMLPGRLFMILGKDIKKEKVIEVTNQYLSITEVPELTSIDKINRGLAKRFKLS